MVEFSSILTARPGLEGERRRQIVAVLCAALGAVDPAAAVRRVVRCSGTTLWVGERCYDLRALRRIVVVGAGKAGAPMAQAIEQILGDRISAGQVNVKYGYVLPTATLRLQEAGHPIPDEAGVAGARAIAALLSGCEAEDLVLCLISGGGSALMTLPVDGVSLQDVQALTGELLRRGAAINEINTLRKHLEQLKGGGLSRLAYPAQVAALILSDVVGSPLDVIASGPTVPDSSTFADAYTVLQRFDLLEQAPESIISHLRRGALGMLADTPKIGESLFERTQNLIVASNDLAARAAESAAAALGFHSQVLTTYLEGEAREVAKVLASIAQEIVATGRPLARPACLIAGGETTVTLKGHGRGGRNQEMALAAALRLAGLRNAAIVCLATDGSDGPTDASGAVADGYTIERARLLGLDPWRALAENDSYPFFAKLNDLLLTGPTNTNVNDLAFVFVW
jgi:glycerate 2-kinase